MSGSLKQDSQKAHAIAFSWDSEHLSLALCLRARADIGHSLYSVLFTHSKERDYEGGRGETET